MGRERVAMVLYGQTNDLVNTHSDLLVFHVLFAFRNMVRRSSHATAKYFETEALGS